MLLFLLMVAICSHVVANADEYGRDDFPADFVFGSGTSAYQVEGAVLEDGRSYSIWDTFAHAGYYNGANGDVACDGYHKYKQDIQLMADTGLEAFRFSISWSRLIPNGRGSVNIKGLQYYNDFIDRLISHGIQPHVTLHHDDLPQILEDEYGGWLSRQSVEDFVAYADVCFKEFGDRVLHWTTFNEPNVFSFGGYDLGFSPPGRCSKPFGLGAINCTKGDSTSEPYIVAHHLLLAHASTVRLYRKKYKATQHGFVGINVFAYWFEPYANMIEDMKAAERAQDFYVGWFLNPLVNGDYPEIMKKNAGNRIPNFTKLESEMVKGQALPRNGTLMDTPRVEFLHVYIGAVLDAIRTGSNTLGYFYWSFFYLLELLDGYKSGYGLYYVDLDDKELTRYPKLSAHWYAGFLKGKNMSDIVENIDAKETFSSAY